MNNPTENVDEGTFSTPPNPKSVKDGEPIPGPSRSKGNSKVAPSGHRRSKRVQGKLEKTFFEKAKSVVGFVKHGILKHYMAAWLPILCHNPSRTEGHFSTEHPAYCRVVFIDGFAGSGSYENSIDGLNCNEDEYGSPTIVYQLALTRKNLPISACPDIILIFIEKDCNNCKKLHGNLLKMKEKNKLARNVEKVNFMVINSSFVDAMEWILSDVFSLPAEASGKIHYPLITDSYHIEIPEEDKPHCLRENKFITNTTPLLVFVDPFGYDGKQMPLTLMRDIQSSSTKSELLINVMTGSIRRFFKLDSRTRPINKLIGYDENDAEWKSKVLKAETSEERINLFLKFYHDRLATDYENVYSARIAMRDTGNRLLYHLFFVTKHVKGRVEMKRAMKKFSQAREEFLFSAFEDMDTHFRVEGYSIKEIKDIVLKNFSGRAEIIMGREISAFLDRTETIVNLYRVGLKKVLENYRVSSKEVRKFDNMKFDFSRRKSSVMPEHSKGSTYSKADTSRKKRREPSKDDDKPKESKIRKNQKQKENDAKNRKITDYFPKVEKK